MFRKICITKYKTCTDGGCNISLTLIAWKVADMNGKQDDDSHEAEHLLDIQEGKNCLQQKVDTMIFLNRSGARYKPFCRELGINYTKGNNNYTNKIDEQH